MMIHRTASIILRNLISLRQSFPSVFQSTVSSAAIKLNSNMKRLIESQQHRQALDLFNQQFRLANDATITLALKASAHLHSYEHGFHIHQQLSTKSLTNPWIQTSLIHFYMQCHHVQIAENIFATIDNKTVFMYGAMFKGFISNGMSEKVIELFKTMSIPPDDVINTLVMNACAKHVTADSKQVGQEVLKRLPSNFHEKHKVANTAIDMLMKFSEVKQAEDLFASMKKKTLVSYGAMMQGYVDNDMAEKALDLFEQLPQPSNHMVSAIVLTACGSSKTDRAVQLGNRIYRDIRTNEKNDNVLLGSILNMLMKFGQVEEAELFFQSTKKKTLGMYGALMQGYVLNEMPEKALDLFEQLSETPDDVIHAIVFSACASLRNERAIQLGHRILDGVRGGRKENPNVIGSILNMLMKFGQVDEAESFFRSTTKKTLEIHGTMMQGYLENNKPEKALDIFETLLETANDVSYIIAFHACASLRDERSMKLGKRLIHEIPIVYKKNPAVLNSMLKMLMTFGQVEEAEQLFVTIEKKTLKNYEAMMHAYNANSLPRSSWTLFRRIKEHKLILNDAVFLELINAASQIGMQSFCHIVVDQLPSECRNNPKINNALIDMWGKSLAVDEAKKIFQSITHPNIYTYNTMIHAYGRNGMGTEAVTLYWTIPEPMRDAISHVCVLNACSHAGLVEQALQIYQQIDVKTDKIVTTMVDCLSRMFMFNEAQQLIDEYEKSHPPLLIMYMVMLSGARNARQSSLAQALYDRMKSLFSNYKSELIPASILLSNIYTSLGDETQAKEIRNHRLQNYGHKVQPGMTMTLVDGKFWEFKAHDRSHPRSAEIYAKLDEIMMKLKEHGYETDSTWNTRPLDNDQSVEEVLCSHSEKLAIAFNLIQDPQPRVIELTKNLRICGDCHAATKLIAKIYQCDIFARDANRGHHFHRNGQCSCLDHF